MREKKIQGKVFVQYVVETDGSLSNVKALRGPGYGAEEESVRVISTSPKWKPGIQNGKAVRVQYTVPVNFSLDNTINHDIKQVTLTPPIQITGPNKPLILVDGKEVDNLNTLSPEDIESISILKDASATKLYGDKGASGVIDVKMKNKPLPPTPIKQK